MSKIVSFNKEDKIMSNKEIISGIINSIITNYGSSIDEIDMVVESVRAVLESLSDEELLEFSEFYYTDIRLFHNETCNYETPIMDSLRRELDKLVTSFNRSVNEINDLSAKYIHDDHQRYYRTMQLEHMERIGKKLNAIY